MKTDESGFPEDFEVVGDRGFGKGIFPVEDFDTGFGMIGEVKEYIYSYRICYGAAEAADVLIFGIKEMGLFKSHDVRFNWLR